MVGDVGGGRDRLYQEVARELLRDLSAGGYAVGSRLPAERDLAQQYDVSRPTVREAIIALEVQGFVEVRIGSGAYVRRLPGEADVPGFNLTAFELTEARLLIEGEAAALAATQVNDDDLLEIEALVQAIAQENHDPKGAEHADRDFHLAIARATRNGAMLEAVRQLWRMREESPDSALLHAMARHANIKPVVDQHRAVLDALSRRDPQAARAAMRVHLSAVLDSLLFAIEEQAIEEARRASLARRQRYSHATATD